MTRRNMMMAHSALKYRQHALESTEYRAPVDSRQTVAKVPPIASVAEALLQVLQDTNSR